MARLAFLCRAEQYSTSDDDDPINQLSHTLTAAGFDVLQADLTDDNQAQLQERVKCFIDIANEHANGSEVVAVLYYAGTAEVPLEDPSDMVLHTSYTRRLRGFELPVAASSPAEAHPAADIAASSPAEVAASSPAEAHPAADTSNLQYQTAASVLPEAFWGDMGDTAGHSSLTKLPWPMDILQQALIRVQLDDSVKSINADVLLVNACALDTDLEYTKRVWQELARPDVNIAAALSASNVYIAQNSRVQIPYMCCISLGAFQSLKLSPFERQVAVPEWQPKFQEAFCVLTFMLPGSVPCPKVVGWLEALEYSSAFDMLRELKDKQWIKWAGSTDEFVEVTKAGREEARGMFAARPPQMQVSEQSIQMQPVTSHSIAAIACHSLRGLLERAGEVSALDGQTHSNKSHLTALSLQASHPDNNRLLVCNLPRLCLLNLSSCGLQTLELSGMPQLRLLIASENNQMTQLPKGISALQSLRSLDLSSCLLNCELPESFSNLKALRQLYLERNVIHGSLPGAWASLTQLEVLDLKDNQLQGGLPPQWRRLQRLRRLDLNNNKLSGHIPQLWKMELTGLTFLDLGANSVTDTPPTHSPFSDSRSQQGLGDCIFRLGFLENAIKQASPSVLQCIVKADLSSRAASHLLGAVIQIMEEQHWSKASSLADKYAAVGLICCAISVSEPPLWRIMDGALLALTAGLAPSAALAGWFAQPSLHDRAVKSAIHSMEKLRGFSLYTIPVAIAGYGTGAKVAMDAAKLLYSGWYSQVPAVCPLLLEDPKGLKVKEDFKALKVPVFLGMSKQQTSFSKGDRHKARDILDAKPEIEHKFITYDQDSESPELLDRNIQLKQKFMHMCWSQPSYGTPQSMAIQQKEDVLEHLRACMDTADGQK